MRLLPIIAAATIGIFATAAVAQSMNTADPNSASGASSTGGPAKRATTGSRQNMDTSIAGNPNQVGGASMMGANTGTGNPDAHKAMAKGKKKKAAAKKHSM